MLMRNVRENTHTLSIHTLNRVNVHILLPLQGGVNNVTTFPHNRHRAAREIDTLWKIITFDYVNIFLTIKTVNVTRKGTLWVHYVLERMSIPHLDNVKEHEKLCRCH